MLPSWISLVLPLSAYLATVSAHPARCKAKASPGKAIYLLTNDKANSVVALPIASNGSVSGGTLSLTKGAGSNIIDGSTNQSGAPDALVSQSALTVVDNNLFAVNAGSNTVTMFNIDPENPTKLTMVGQPAPVPGDFPNTVAASGKNGLVCVGSSGARSGISCASFSMNGIGVMDPLRPLGLNQTTPPVGPPNTLSQVFFSADEKDLFATVKGDPSKNLTGFLAAYAIGEASGVAAVSQQVVHSSPNGTAVLFGASTIRDSNDIFVTDASFGAIVLSVDRGLEAATVKGRSAIDGQKATCWVAVSPATNSAFVTDVAMNRLVEMSLTDARIRGVVDLSSNGDPGLIDLKAAGKYIYALSPGNGTTQAAVTVVDAMKKKQVQHFGLQGLGVGKNAQGMAVLL